MVDAFAQLKKESNGRLEVKISPRTLNTLIRLEFTLIGQNVGSLRLHANKKCT